MSSRKIYDDIYTSNIEKLSSGDVHIDRHLREPEHDFRMGISLVIPIRSMEDSYNALISSLQKIAPDQYYYPFDDLHITIFDFIQANENYKQNPEIESLLLKTSLEAFELIRPFNMKFEGVVFSNAAGLIQGYDDDILTSIRESIRRSMEENGIKNDERYRSRTAHITFMRFINNLSKESEFCEFIRNNREMNIGDEHVTEVELVEHDWYNRKETKRVIGKIEI